MQQDCALRITGRGLLTSFLGEYKTGKTKACLSVLNRVYKAKAEVDMPLRRFRRQYEQLSQFERKRIIGMKEAGWSARRAADCVESNCVWCLARGNWTAEEWNQVVFRDESRFNLSSDDNRVRVRRPRGERLNPALLYSDTPLPKLV
ncbi:transposable element Tcb2 transposase [Trichonephila clavipes]|nr:transposable element Tcb2 transposase [Trichonephila clavipes]